MCGCKGVKYGFNNLKGMPSVAVDAPIHTDFLTRICCECTVRYKLNISLKLKR